MDSRMHIAGFVLGSAIGVAAGIMLAPKIDMEAGRRMGKKLIHDGKRIVRRAGHSMSSIM